MDTSQDTEKRFNKIVSASVIRCFWIIISFCCITLNVCTIASAAGDDPRDISEEKRLITDLLSNYNRVGKSGRPVLNISHAVTVYFGLGLIQLDLDEKNKILTMSMWTRYAWKDSYMTWNNTDYGGVRSVKLEHDLIWIPDVTLYNTADVSDNYREALAVVSYDGTVHWYPHTIYRSSCSIDVTHFPYDHQVCHMWFGSWTHTSSEIDLQMAFDGGIDLSTFQSDYKDTCAWEILNVSGNRSIMPSEDHDPNFAVMKFNINMKRKLVFSTYILTLPCVFLACLTLVVFWLPPERPDRIGLAMSIFSSFMLLLLILVEAAPPTASSVPKLGVYYCFNMVIIMVSIILSSIIINISRGFNQPLPHWLFVLTNSKLSRLMCARYINERKCKGKASKAKPRSEADYHSCKLLLNHDANACQMNGDGKGFEGLTKRSRDCMTKDFFKFENGHHIRLSTYCNSSASLNDKKNTSYSLSKSEMQLHELQSATRSALESLGSNFSDVNRTLNRIEMQLHTKASDDIEIPCSRYAMQWRQLAVVLDRVFFLIYVILVVVSLCTLFPRETLPPPH